MWTHVTGSACAAYCSHCSAGYSVGKTTAWQIHQWLPATSFCRDLSTLSVLHILKIFPRMRDVYHPDIIKMLGKWKVVEQKWDCLNQSEQSMTSKEVHRSFSVIKILLFCQLLSTVSWNFVICSSSCTCRMALSSIHVQLVAITRMALWREPSGPSRSPWRSVILGRKFSMPLDCRLF